MATAAMNIDDLLRRHLELVIRLYDAGHTVLALEAALAALQHEPPSLDSPLVSFLMHPLLTTLVGGHPAAGDFRRYVHGQRGLRKAVLWWVRFGLDGAAAESSAVDGGQPLANQLLQVRELLERESTEPAPPLPPPRLPPGCAWCVVVEPAGDARLTRIHVRFGNWGRLDQGNIVGQAVPGAAAALDAARQYLAASGCEPIDGLQAEVLVEGLFRPVQGESLALAIFVAAVSARLQMPLASSWAFTGAVGSPSSGSAAGAVMPVNEIQAKLAAGDRAGCLHLMVPAHLLAEGAVRLTHGRCTLAPVTTTVEAVERTLPEHRLAESPRIVGWREYVNQWLKAVVPGGPCPAGDRHRAFRIVVPCFFVVMLTERWLIADYLVPEYYLGVRRAPLWLAAFCGGVAAAALAGTLYASLRVVDRLLDCEAIVNWWLAAALLLAGCVLAWLPAQALIRDPFATPPRGAYFEHRTLQGWKDTAVLFLYALIFFVSPYTRVRLAERAGAARRLQWVREILEGRRWAHATFPAATVPLLVVIASVALMGFGFLDWQALTDPSRAGSGPGNGPWRAIHVIGRAQLYLLSCIAVLWWLGRSASRAAAGDSGRGT